MALARLIIKDEVNVKIEGLDLHERKELSNMFKYEIPGARYLPAVRLGRWDGKIAFFQMGGSTYVNLLPEIIPYLDSQGYHLELEDLRDYKTQYDFEQVTEDSYVAELTKQIEKLSGLKITRIRLSWLKPTGGYPMHADVDPMRIHIPIFTNTLAYFVQGHKIYHMQYGKLYHLVTTSNHTAWNFGKLPRLHLIFSTYHCNIWINCSVSCITWERFSSDSTWGNERLHSCSKEYSSTPL